jgi:hypothetical protein
VTEVLDTSPAAAETAAAQAFSATPVLTPREAWRRARLPVIVGGVVILAAVLQAVLTGAVSADRLDPTAAGPQGGRALAALLRDHSVDVRTVDVPSGGADTTVFYAAPHLAGLTPGSLESSANATEVVVVEPLSRDLAALRTRIVVAGHDDEDVRDPVCDQPDAVAAGAVLLGGFSFGAPTDAVACYPSRGDAAFVEHTESGGRRVTALGSGSFMTNEHLGQQGNAALALRLLSRHPTVEWVYPRSVPVPGGERRSLRSLLPHRLFVLVAELLVVVLLLALWRGRRLGPVVVEPLPVVVRAAEAVEGRARLYEAARAREAAANALRAGLRDRLVRVLGLAPDADAATMVAAVTARARASAPDVGDLLYGPPPPDDAALVRLADQLDRLDSEVRAQ